MNQPPADPAAPAEPSDAALMTALQGGDDSALDELMARWRDRVGAFLFRVTGSHTAAVDLTQETFVRLYRSRARFRPKRAAFPSWLFAIAANLARNRARWLRRHPTVPLDEPAPDNDNPGPPRPRDLPSPDPAPDQVALTAESLRAIRDAFAALPPELREAIALFVDHNLGYREIAAIARCSPKAAEMRIYRARQLLKSSLAHLRSPA